MNILCNFRVDQTEITILLMLQKFYVPKIALNTF